MTSDALASSDVTGPWTPPLTGFFICPPPPEPTLCAECHRSSEDVCDCGFDGPWEHRWVYLWNEEPGYIRGDEAVRRDIERGMPPRFGDQGWWVIQGFDERCPGCGDIERFDLNASLVRQFSDSAAVATLRSGPLALVSDNGGSGQS